MCASVWRMRRWARGPPMSPGSRMPSASSAPMAASPRGSPISGKSSAPSSAAPERARAALSGWTFGRRELFGDVVAAIGTDEARSLDDRLFDDLLGVFFRQAQALAIVLDEADIVAAQRTRRHAAFQHAAQLLAAQAQLVHEAHGD